MIPCPGCGAAVVLPKCTACGAEQRVNPASGNIMWLRRGRVLAAFEDEKAQWEAMAARYGIARGDPRTPEKFR